MTNPDELAVAFAFDTAKARHGYSYIVPLNRAEQAEDTARKNAAALNCHYDFLTIGQNSAVLFLPYFPITNLDVPLFANMVMGNAAWDCLDLLMSLPFVHLEISVVCEFPY